ncbi:MAG: hypothetical protein WBQ94_17145 [Terracidiphilus sp.]
MTTDLKLLKQLASILRQSGLEAMVEYPGYIAIGPRSYGTANGVWGWSDCDGHGEDSEIPGLSQDVSAIRRYILHIERRESPEVTKAYGSDEEYLKDVDRHFINWQLDYACHYHSDVIHTGGGIYNLAVMVTDRVQLRFGTAGDNWGADVYVDGDFIDGESLRSEEKIEEDRPRNAAHFIINTVETFRHGQMQKILAAVDDALIRAEKEKIYRALVHNFAEAASALSAAWDALPADSGYHEWPCKDYPFSESFDEIASKIRNWEFTMTSERS